MDVLNRIDLHPLQRARRMGRPPTQKPLSIWRFSSSVRSMLDPGAIGFFFAAASSNAPSAPTFPFGGGLIWWFICARRKHQSIGGWLLFYYWQIFSGAALGAVLLVSIGYSGYMPEAYDKTSDYWWFVLSGAPGLLLLFVHAAAALMLLCVRTWDVFLLLRNIVLGQVVFEWLAVAIDLWKFPNDLALDLIAAIQMSLWLIYLFRSVRVERVFKHHNWEQGAALSPTLGLA